MAVGLKMTADWFIGAWIHKSMHLKPETYPRVYLLLIVLFGIVTVVKSLFYGYTQADGSVALFKKLFWNVLRRPLRFFDTTPSG